MCGIIGYVGNQQAWPLLETGLRRLEYRGYDSAGIATLHRHKLRRARAIGPLAALTRAHKDPLPGTLGIGHTRWATHGDVSLTNCHPHFDADERVAIVHNGILDNLDELRALLPADTPYTSQTDSELLAHLIADALERTHDVLEATRVVLEHVRGTAAIVVLSREHPHHLVAARIGSPLLIATTQDAAFVASDPDALAGLTHEAIALDDGELVEIGPGHLRSTGLGSRERATRVAALAIPEPDDVDTPTDSHYLRELREQPEALERALRGRLDRAMATARFEELPDPRLWHRFERVVLTGCGTSLNAARLGALWLTRDARIPAHALDAAELASTHPIIEPRTLYVALSQSGETADVLAVTREIRLKGGWVLGMTNIPGSSLARESDACLFMHAGRERSVAATKSFTSQLVTLAMLTLGVARSRSMSPGQGRAWIDALERLPQDLEHALSHAPEIESLAKTHAHAPMTMFVGRGASTPLAMEGALKLKELSYVACEGLSSASMKHGPIALIEPGTPVWACGLQDTMSPRLRGNLEGLRARGADILGVLEDPKLRELCTHVFEIPQGPFAAIPAIVPWQLYAYHVARTLGRPIDRPRNLAKSVTVE